MNIRERQEAAIELKDMVQEYVTEEMVIQPKDFNRLFHLRFGRAGCTGGMDRYGRPSMKLSVNDRYFDKEATIEELLNKPFLATSRQAVWRKAYENAKKGKWWHVEYHRIHMQKDIGSFCSDNYEDHVLSTICHEFAHVVCYWRMKTERLARPQPHGETWQKFYRELRNEFFNPWISQEEKDATYKIPRDTSRVVL